MDSSFDLSKIIGMIAENPEIINLVKGLISQGGEHSSEPSEESDSGEEAVKTSAEESKDGEYTDEGEDKVAEAVSLTAKGGIRDRRSKRRELLCALKPYVSKDRSRAIDTMLSFAEVLDVLKGD